MRNHHPSQKIGVLLTNVGTPAAPTIKAARRYLAEFLSDPRIISFPRSLWWQILHGFILRLRPRIIAKRYQKIWREEGSPLIFYSEKLREKLQAQFNNKVIFSIGMRYDQPSLAKSLQQLNDAGVKKILIMPLYPQFSATTTGSTFDAISAFFKTQPQLPQFRMVMGYHDHPAYISALTEHIEQFWKKNDRGEKLLFSFHGLPKKNVKLGDPYETYCYETAQCLAEKLQLGKKQWQVTFQSRFKFQAWLQPYTNETLIKLAKQGNKTVDVICPGFAVDCLETLEEIKTRSRKRFVQHGGLCMHYIPALNDSFGHVTALTAIINENLRGWLDGSNATNSTY